MAEQLDFLIIWVPDHRKIFCNEKANDLEKLGELKRELYMHFVKIAQSRWESTTKQIWLKYDKNRNKDLINRSRKYKYTDPDGIRTNSHYNGALVFWSVCAKNETVL